MKWLFNLETFSYIFDNSVYNVQLNFTETKCFFMVHKLKDKHFNSKNIQKIANYLKKYGFSYVYEDDELDSYILFRFNFKNLFENMIKLISQSDQIWLSFFDGLYGFNKIIVEEQLVYLEFGKENGRRNHTIISKETLLDILVNFNTFLHFLWVHNIELKQNELVNYGNLFETIPIKYYFSEKIDTTIFKNFVYIENKFDPSKVIKTWQLNFATNIIQFADSFMSICIDNGRMDSIDFYGYIDDDNINASYVLVETLKERLKQSTNFGIVAKYPLISHCFKYVQGMGEYVICLGYNDDTVFIDKKVFIDFMNQIINYTEYIREHNYEFGYDNHTIDMTMNKYKNIMHKDIIDDDDSPLRYLIYDVKKLCPNFVFVPWK